MPSSTKLYFLLSTLIFSTQLAFAGGDTPVETDACDEIELVLSNIKHPNPMKEEYRPSRDLYNSINHLFYAVQEGRIATRTVRINGQLVEQKYAEIPVYGWFERSAGFDMLTVFQRQDFFDLRGCYMGSQCIPVTFFQERSEYVPLKKWVPWQQVCKDLDHPLNGIGVKTKILAQIREDNLYGLLRKKGLPNDIVFYDKYTPYVYKSFDVSDEEFFSRYDKNGKPAAQSIPAPILEAPVKVIPSAPIPENPQSVEIVTIPPPPGIPEIEIIDDTPPTVQIDVPPPPAPVVAPTPAPVLAPTPGPAVTPPPSPAPAAAPTPAPAAPKPVPAPAAKPQAEEISPPPAPTQNTTQKPQSSLNGSKYPTATPVPGKAGWVYSPFTKTKIEIDVTGFPSGSKVRDPETQGIFIVP